MPFETWLIFAVTTCIASMTPGPNMLLALTIGMTKGTRAAAAAACGGVISMLILLFISAAGLSAILAASTEAFMAIKWGGVAYLIYLGIKAWRSPAESLDPANAAAEQDSRARSFRKLFTQAFVVGMSNPKAIVFFAAFIPQFIDPALPQGPQLAVIAATFTVIETFWLMSYATGGNRLVPLLKRAGKVKLINRITGGTLIGAGALLATR